MISKFKLMNWRNCQRAQFDFERKNLFIGPNGSGKSNLLEALGFLGVLRSFRTARLGETIQLGAESAHLRCEWRSGSSRGGAAVNSSSVLEVAINRSGERRLLVNNHLERSGRDFIQHFYPVVFAPEDIQMINGAPGERRRFIDMLASQLDDGYINVLHDYLAALKMRNQLLKKSRNVDMTQLEVYEGLLAFAGADLTLRRQKCVEQLNHTLSTLEGGNTGRIAIEYLPQCAGGAEAYLAAFDRSRRREMEKHTTLTGCHLDDYRFLRGNTPMKGFASTGQNRLAALNCKLSAALLVMRRRGADKLIALVDDVTGELDLQHRQKFYETLEPAGQMFFTFTALPEENFFREAQIWNLPL
ncbi:MAG: DNA replication and repair protein RecF [Lentisphaerae bacterium]|nr:DNA replication and repair protein RecF [Lentisphaerota bacterium]